MSYLILKHLPALLLAAPVLAWAYLNLRTPRQARALLLAAAGLGAAVLVVVAAAALARVPTDGWSAARLAPPASLLRGYRLYYPPGEGPALVRMYGPVPWLLYAPAVALGRPTPAMLAAAGINLLCFALPVAWTLRRMTPARHRRVHGGAVGVAAGVAFGVVAALATQLTYTACAVTVDAPAIGFAACACTAAATARGGRAALAAGLFAS